jgi:Tfp pilus assembly protein PilV
MTLVEVLVASVLLGIGVSGLMLTASLGLRNQQRTEQRAAALYLANEKLGEIEMTGARMWSLTHPTSGAETRGGIEYTWSTRITPRTEGELSEVLVEVDWQGRSTAGGKVELETLLNDYKALTAAKPLDERQGGAMDVKGPGRE